MPKSRSDDLFLVLYPKSCMLWERTWWTMAQCVIAIIFHCIVRHLTCWYLILFMTDWYIQMYLVPFWAFNLIIVNTVEWVSNPYSSELIRTVSCLHPQAFSPPFFPTTFSLPASNYPLASSGSPVGPLNNPWIAWLYPSWTDSPCPPTAYRAHPAFSSLATWTPVFYPRLIADPHLVLPKDEVWRGVYPMWGEKASLVGRATHRAGPAHSRSHSACHHLAGLPEKVSDGARRRGIEKTCMVSRERRHRSNCWTDCSLSHYHPCLISPRTRLRPIWDHLQVTSYSHASRSVAGQEKERWGWGWKWRKRGPGRGLCRRRGGTWNCSLPKPSVRSKL